MEEETDHGERREMPKGRKFARESSQAGTKQKKQRAVWKYTGGTSYPQGLTLGWERPRIQRLTRTELTSISIWQLGTKGIEQSSRLSLPWVCLSGRPRPDQRQAVTTQCSRTVTQHWGPTLVLEPKVSIHSTPFVTKEPTLQSKYSNPEKMLSEQSHEGARGKI